MNKLSKIIQNKSSAHKTAKKIYTISELTKEIRFSLENVFTNIWIEGEISNFIKHTSGHCYMSLKDAQSVIPCVIFKNIAENFKFEIENGMHIVCYGRVSVYEKRGQYQFYIEQIQPKGAGKLQIAYEQLKNKLYKEGLFDESAKKPLPILPECVGVVTSPTGAAIRDILNVINRRFPNMHIILYPVKVQGPGASEQIACAIETFNQLSNVDVIIVGRGGGSLEDLWAFNEEIVARSIYNSDIPVISAVGHEIDYTISDFVADFRAPTPSAAAEIVAGKKQDFIDNVDALKQRLTKALKSDLATAAQTLDSLKQRYAFKQPAFMLQQNFQLVDDLTKALVQNLKHFMDKQGLILGAHIKKLETLNPIAILGRGYSITTMLSDGSIIKDSRQVKSAELVETRLGKGSFISKTQ